MSNDEARQLPYRRYTTRFDVVAEWRALDRLFADKPMIISGANAPAPTSVRSLDQEWTRLETLQPGWRDALRADARALSARLDVATGPEALSDTAFTLLVDQSGSMRGEKVRYASAALDIVQAMLTSLGVKVEVLGFTTRFWRGGQSRWWWSALGRKASPGRLNDLLHIVYRAADAPAAGETPEVFREMLRPELLKENVDGEALEWAVSRLRARPEQRRLLLLVSDGAPVDDSTLGENDANILCDHLREVVASITDARDVELAGFGIGYVVTDFYARSWSVDAPVEIGAGLLRAIDGMLTGPQV